MVDDYLNGMGFTIVYISFQKTSPMPGPTSYHPFLSIVGGKCRLLSRRAMEVECISPIAEKTWHRTDLIADIVVGQQFCSELPNSKYRSSILFPMYRLGREIATNGIGHAEEKGQKRTNQKPTFDDEKSWSSCNPFDRCNKDVHIDLVQNIKPI